MDKKSILLLTTIILSLFGLSPAKAEISSTTASTATSTGTFTIPPEEIPLQKESVTASLNSITSDLNSDRVLTTLREELPLTLQEINARLEENSRYLAMTRSMDTLRRMEYSWQRFAATFDDWQNQIIRRVQQLEKEEAALTQLQSTWQRTLEAAQTSSTPAPVIENIRNVLVSIQDTYSRVEERRNQILRLQYQVSLEDAHVDRELDYVRHTRQELLDHLDIRDADPLWHSLLHPATSQTLLEREEDSLGMQIKSVKTYAVQRIPRFVIHVFILIFFMFLITMANRNTRAWIAPDIEIGNTLAVLRVPLAAAIVLSLLATAWIYPHAPRLLLATWGGIALVPTIIVLRQIFHLSLYPLLDALAVFYFVDQIRSITASLPDVTRLLLAAEMLGGALFLTWQIRAAHGTKAIQTGLSPRIIHAILRILQVGFFLCFLANAIGYLSLSLFIGDALLRSLYIAVIFYTLFRIIDAAFLFILSSRLLGAFRVVRQHRMPLWRRISLLLQIMAWILWALHTLNLLGIRDAVMNTLHRLGSAALHFGSVSLSLEQITAFVITVWAAFFVSRLLRFLLAEDVYPRLHLRQGLPYAISTLLHYVILTVGFFFAIAALGFDMTKFTILAGAFGVGVGFGTQNIINNFVSGLILLFERPVKVGDVIQVDDATGVIQKIGIRATVIRTTNDSNVIVPNGSLISKQVINWTMDRGLRMMDIPVSSASNADPGHVMALLKTVVEAHPLVAKDPQPQVLFVKLSSGSLDFNVRIWTARVNQIVSLQSELILAIHAALAKENLAIH